MGFAAKRNWVYFGVEDFIGISFAGILSSLAGNLSFHLPSVSAWVWGVLLSIGVTAAALAWLSRRRRGTRREIRGYSTLDGESRKTMLKLYGKMVAILARKGLPGRQPYQPPYEYAAMVCSRLPHAREPVAWLTRAATIAAYDPRPFNSLTAEAARRWLSQLKRALAGRP